MLLLLASGVVCVPRCEMYICTNISTLFYSTCTYGWLYTIVVGAGSEGLDKLGLNEAARQSGPTEAVQPAEKFGLLLLQMPPPPLVFFSPVR